MATARSRDTLPELVVRRAAHRRGLRFRLFRKDLPGKPDLAFSRWKTAIFVNGCFWHRHASCPKASFPKTNTSFWKRKLDRNVERDRENYRDLSRMGWRVLTIWECETGDVGTIDRRLAEWFNE
jgi:DNA mismatch endonuclease (patch repair protein)